MGDKPLHSVSTRSNSYRHFSQLLDSVSLEQVVFLLDATTDEVFLQQTLQDSWRRVRPDSPNRRLKAPEARLLHIAGQKAADVSGLVKLLLEGPAVLRNAA